mmetsp:Transcript_16347/g.38974  ORF Transcript_16347/g.38974 Transcript_16347/m.38974 type:complete len:132 (-) Transcript_16347:193-588(-)
MMVGKRMWWEAEAEEAEAGWKTVGLTATTHPSRSALRLPPGAPRGSAPGASGPAMNVGVDPKSDSAPASGFLIDEITVFAAELSRLDVLVLLLLSGQVDGLTGMVFSTNFDEPAQWTSVGPVSFEEQCQVC